MRLTMAALSTHNMDFAYPAGNGPVFEQLSLQLPFNRVTAILGPNGSGKTTLLDLFLGLLTPTAGTVAIHGKGRTTYASKDLKRIIGLVPQNESIPFDLSLLEYVLLGRAPFLGLLQTPGPRDRSAALAAIDQVGLARLQHRPVPQMSGGERQLASVARALAQESQILLMDEPTSHLDLANARRILNLMSRIKRHGRTVLFTTHDPNAAAAAADHVVLLKQGCLLAAGGVAETLTTELLSATYDQPIEVVRTHLGPMVSAYTDSPSAVTGPARHQERRN
jgi:iron complex transport system ATP-binding protein